jgi:hypothetical protein
VPAFPQRRTESGGRARSGVCPLLPIDGGAAQASPPCSSLR